MSIRVMSYIWDNGPEDRNELLVMLALADFADDYGRCFPSVRRIAEKSRMTERGVQKIIARLIESGALEVNVGGGRAGCNHYKIVRKDVAEGGEHGSGGESGSGGEQHSGGERGDKKPRTPVQKTPNRRSPEPSITTNEPSDVRAVRAALCVVVSEQAADDFIAHRKAKRAKLTVRAAELIAAKLKGHPDPDAVVNESISQGWTGVFPEKVTAQGKPALRVVGGRYDQPQYGEERVLKDGRRVMWRGGLDGWVESR